MREVTFLKCELQYICIYILRTHLENKYGNFQKAVFPVFSNVLDNCPTVTVKWPVVNKIKPDWVAVHKFQFKHWEKYISRWLTSISRVFFHMFDWHVFYGFKGTKCSSVFFFFFVQVMQLRTVYHVQCCPGRVKQSKNTSKYKYIDNICVIFMHL